LDANDPFDPNVKLMIWTIDTENNAVVLGFA